MSEHIIETEISNGALFIPYQSKLSEAVREQIVRCRDCVYNAKDTDGICYRFDHEHFNQPDGFCAWGEQKEGE